MKNLYQTWVTGGSGYAVLQDKQIVENRRFNNDSAIEDDEIIEDSKLDGVYVVSATGELIDYNTADTTALGVALIAGEHKFMIAKSDASSDGDLYWGRNIDVTGVVNNDRVDGNNLYGGYLPKPDGTFEDSEWTHLSGDFTTWTAGALSDFNGKANTEAIAAASSDVRDMCTVLNTFNASDIHNDWYVPACGQLALMYLNKTEINAALAKIGGTTLAAVTHWSSSESSDCAWCVSFKKGTVHAIPKDEELQVRFVRDLQ